MDPKLAILFLLISVIIGLSNIEGGLLARVRSQFSELRWRQFVPARRRS